MYYKDKQETANFWTKLDKPFFCLAPMSDVTDIAFRYILAKYGRPARPPKGAGRNKENRNKVVFWTEFVAADGLCNKLARKKLAHILKYSPIEKPIVAQVFGANPANMKSACQYIASLGFDGIDINMGCPDKSVVAQGAGSALIRTPELARKIIQSALEGIASAGQNIPVSVKTRVGFNKEEIDTWIPELLKENISALTIHARTKKEESMVPANWDYLKQVRKLIVKSGKGVLLIGNGDIQDLVEAKEKAEKYECDGVMIGRGVFGNPWFFNESNTKTETQARPWVLSRPGLRISLHTLNQKIEILKEHIKIFDEKLLKTGDKSYAVMKKHFKAYINGFPGAQEMRVKLMETETPAESLRLLDTFQKGLK